MQLSGPYKSNGRTKLPSFDWTIAFTGGGANFDGRLTSTGDDVFVGFQGQNYDAGTNVIARYNQTLDRRDAEGMTASARVRGGSPPLAPTSAIVASWPGARNPFRLVANVSPLRI